MLFTGIFFVLPCIENYSKVDLRTAVIDIPPQEVCLLYECVCEKAKKKKQKEGRDLKYTVSREEREMVVRF